MLNLRKIIFLFVIILGIFPLFSNAQTYGSFSVSPPKSEFNLKPGEKIKKIIIISNNTGKRMNFEVDFEDFIPSLNVETPIQFGKSGKDTSLKNFVIIDKKNFSLENKEKTSLAVNVDIPKDISSSGLFGAVMISANSSESESGAAKVLVQIPSLFFIRIIGNEKPAGIITDFEYKEGVFSVNFENQGNVHLNPAGEIELKNIFGRTVKKMTVMPWFVLPASSRSTDIIWDNRPNTYIYEADLKLSPGFGGKDLVVNRKIWIYSLDRILFNMIFIFVIVLFIGLTKFLKK